MLEWTVEATGWGLCALALVMWGPATVCLIFQTVPRKQTGPIDPDGDPLVSVIVPARDEGPHIEPTLRSLLASNDSNLEVVAVNDRSQDDTGAVMDRLAAIDSRLRVIHIDHLPDGWLGKNHALQTGADAARGQFLLFTDGDVLFAPDAVALTVRYAQQRRIDHLALFPRLISGGYWEDALTAFFGLLFIFGTQPWLVPSSWKRMFVGVGAFNLVRRSAYEQVGGHRPIRLDVLDDLKLGKLIKREGFRQAALRAEELVCVRWQNSAWGVIRGLEKNAFAGLNYSMPRLLMGTVIYLFVLLAPYLAVGWFPLSVSIGSAVALLLMHGLYGLAAHLFGGRWTIFPVLPIAALGMLWAFWRSALIAWRQGGICWRDTTYPLPLLRDNLYR